MINLKIVDLQTLCAKIDALDDATSILWAVAVVFVLTVGRWLLFDDDDPA